MNKQKLWLMKLKISLLSASRIFARPQYILLVVFGAFLASGLILWSLNLSLVRYILFEAPLTLLQKLDFFFDVYKNLYTTYSGVQGTGIALFSLLFGINLALLVFVLKHRNIKSIPKKSGLGGFGLAIIGGGCIACGTSIITPIIATFGATSTTFLRDLSAILSWLGSMLIAYSIYKLGTVCSYIFATKEN